MDECDEHLNFLQKKKKRLLKDQERLQYELERRKRKCIQLEPFLLLLILAVTSVLRSKPRTLPDIPARCSRVEGSQVEMLQRCAMLVLTSVACHLQSVSRTNQGSVA
jgi:hypothetical protein